MLLILFEQQTMHTDPRMRSLCPLLPPALLPQARMASIAKASQGFVYLVSVTGVTGMKEQVENRVEGLVDMLHNVTDKPVSSHTSHCLARIYAGLCVIVERVMSHNGGGCKDREMTCASVVDADNEDLGLGVMVE